MKKIVVSFLVLLSLVGGFKGTIHSNNVVANNLVDREQIVLAGDEKDPQILSIRLDKNL